ncbi:hypothetical protein HDU98_006553 [Podochytrium sp. JEL0797]|nr:hypothetical protein HDU98_006553 [Podochytrium sp. JEL0797]
MAIDSTTPPTGPAAAAPSQLHLFLQTISVAEPLHHHEPVAPIPDVYSEYKRLKERQRLVRIATQRDSQAQRMKPGKEGSRRRRRQENDTFAHHPLVKALDPLTSSLFDRRDLFPGPMMPQPKTIFTGLPRSQAKVSMDVLDADLEAANASAATPHIHLCRCTRTCGPHALSRADRMQIAKGLRKWGEGREVELAGMEVAVLRHFEEVFNPVVVEMQDAVMMDSDDWIVVSAHGQQLHRGGGEGEMVPEAKTDEMMDSGEIVENGGDAFGHLVWGEWTATYATDNFEKERSGQEGWCEVVKSGAKGMSLIIRDQFLRVAIHALAKYYGLKCNS